MSESRGFEKIMRENKRLFPIGVLSKLTGVHIRCLRYYEQLGILHPAYVDEKTGYRYYTYRQMRVVEAIQYCVELDIPLKKFSEFISQENRLIDYDGLAAYGRIVTEKKIQAIRQRQKLLEAMTNGMMHAEKCAENGRMTEHFSQEHYYCMPYQGTQSDIEFQSAMVRLINELEANGFRASYDNGIMMRAINAKKEHFCFVNIQSTDKDITQYPQIITIPEGDYICMTTTHSGCAEQIFEQELASNQSVFITETELFTGRFPYDKPTYELRCYLGEKL